VRRALIAVPIRFRRKAGFLEMHDARLGWRTEIIGGNETLTSFRCAPLLRVTQQRHCEEHEVRRGNLIPAEKANDARSLRNGHRVAGGREYSGRIPGDG